MGKARTGRIMRSIRARSQAQGARSRSQVSGGLSRARLGYLQQRSTGSKAEARAFCGLECRPGSASAEKKGFCWKRTRHSHRSRQDSEQKHLKQADLATLELAAQDGHIDLKDLDESGFCLWNALLSSQRLWWKLLEEWRLPQISPKVRYRFNKT